MAELLRPARARHRMLEAALSSAEGGRRPEGRDGRIVMGSEAREANPFAVDRGVPVVATWPRQVGFALGGAAAIVGIGQGYISFSHSTRTLESLLPWLVSGAVSVVLIVIALLPSDESPPKP